MLYLVLYTTGEKIYHLPVQPSGRQYTQKFSVGTIIQTGT